ncbi:chorismate-binding protein [Anaeromyxobacter oryzae]|uniref:Aminodeoxychorismate synthase, component I n=1 Tax=Anaeromyxobacter oryzae TaxID=2918170 RepID=A0ABM7WVU7_9BACT|nr:chorismate-binding protein [Anaeromyxobacter oryzae]BDG03621.1 aminodeoxychorismate synthase, component I [Anaeromyxobacter oryzae]
MEPGSAVLDLDGFLPPLAFGRPRDVVVASTLEEVRPALRAVERAAAAGAHAVGFLAYEAAPALDRALVTRPPGPGPLVWFGLHDAPAPRPEPRAPARLGPLVPDVEERDHAGAVARLREAIAAGEAYQVNHTFRLAGPFEGDPLALYARLRAAQGGGLGACLALGDDRAIVSASPELFFAVAGRRIIARPMKGTARRGRSPAEDEARAAALAASEKDRAENVMIADLLRNDLGRVATIGSVRVTALCDVERLRTVFQLTSTVEARLRPSAGLADVLAAAFPCGSVTGAPKASAMRLIAREEASPRGAYCGAIGVVLPGGDAVFNVGIRTVELDLSRGRAVAGVGGGITWASSAAAEWDEALAKGAFLADPGPPYELVETLRLERGAYPLLDRHLARISASARHLGFVHDDARLAEALRAEAARGGDGRVRLRLAPEGAVAVERGPLPAVAAEPVPVALAAAPVPRDAPLLFHKTTERSLYDGARRARPGVFDVLLWNEDGDVTEFTIGNVVCELGGERVTPPVAAGLLPGVYRAHLLARGEVRERPIAMAEALAASRVWLVNAVRGWVPVRLVGSR